MPELPAEIAQAFVDVWQQAVSLAASIAEQGLDERRQTLESEREQVAQREDAVCLDAAQHRQHTAEAVAARQNAERRLADLERLIEQHLQQVEDLREQRDGFKLERDAGQERIQALEFQLLSDRQEAEQSARQVLAWERRFNTQSIAPETAQQTAAAQKARADLLEAQLHERQRRRSSSRKSAGKPALS